MLRVLVSFYSPIPNPISKEDLDQTRIMIALFWCTLFYLSETNAEVYCKSVGSGADGKQSTYCGCCCILCCSLCHPCRLVVFGATVTAVTVYICLTGTLLIVDFTWMGRPSSLCSVLPQQGTHPLNGTPPWHLTGEIWEQTMGQTLTQNKLVTQCYKVE